MARTFRNKRTGEVVTVDEQGRVLQQPMATTPSGTPSATPQPQMRTQVPGMERQPAPTPGPAPQVQAPSGEPGRFMGGAVPLMLGIPGGMVGGIPGAAAMTGVGVIIENLLEDLLGRQQETQAEQSKTMLKESALAGLGEAGGRLVGKGITRLGRTKVAQEAMELLGKKFPKALIKTALPETSKAAETAVKKAVTETGEELSSEILNRGVAGSAKQLVQTGIEGMDAMDDVIVSKLNKLPTIIDERTALETLDEVVDRTITQVSKTVNSASDIASLNDEARDLLRLQRKRVGEEGWEGLWNLRKSADAKTKGKAATQISAISNKFNAELANQLRTEIASLSDEIASDVLNKQFFIRLTNASTRRAAQAPFTHGDVWRLAFGAGAGGILGGVPGAAAGAAAMRAPFSPFVTTHTAQALKGLVPRLMGAAQKGVSMLPSLGQVGAVGMGRFSEPTQTQSAQPRRTEPTGSKSAQTTFDENKFRQWYAKIAAKHGLSPDPDDPQHFYDYRTAYMAGIREPDASGHWPSVFKRQGHPTYAQQ